MDDLQSPKHWHHQCAVRPFLGIPFLISSTEEGQHPDVARQHETKDCLLTSKHTNIRMSERLCGLAQKVPLTCNPHNDI